MLRHIVFFKLKDDNKAENLKIMKEKLIALKKDISFILDISFNEDCYHGSASFDAVLSVDLPSKDKIEPYLQHDIHQAVVAWIKSVILDRAVVDFEYN